MQKLFKDFGLLVNLIKIGKMIYGKKVMIIGSSPFSDFRRYQEGMIVVNLNGSVARNIISGIPEPQLTFLDFEIIDPSINTVKPSRSIILEKSILKNINLGYVILTQSNSSKGGDIKLVADSFIDVLSIHTKLRRLFVLISSRNRSLDSRDGKLSTGGFALAFISVFSPESIYLTGFSFFKQLGSDNSPHSYDDGLNLDQHVLTDPRSHSLADAYLISNLALRGMKIESDDKDLKPLISNWGAR